MSDCKFYVYLNPNSAPTHKGFRCRAFFRRTRVSAVFMQENPSGEVAEIKNAQQE